FEQFLVKAYVPIMTHGGAIQYVWTAWGPWQVYNTITKTTSYGHGAGLKSVHPVTGKPSTAALGKPLQSVNGSYTATIRKGQWWLSGPSVWNGWFVNPNSGSPTPHDAHFEDHVGFAQKAVYYGHMEAMVRGTTNAVC